MIAGSCTSSPARCELLAIVYTMENPVSAIRKHERARKCADDLMTLASWALDRVFSELILELEPEVQDQEGSFAPDRAYRNGVVRIRLNGNAGVLVWQLPVERGLARADDAMYFLILLLGFFGFDRFDTQSRYTLNDRYVSGTADNTPVNRAINQRSTRRNHSIPVPDKRCVVETTKARFDSLAFNKTTRRSGRRRCSVSVHAPFFLLSRRPSYVVTCTTVVVGGAIFMVPDAGGVALVELQVIRADT